MGRYNFVAAGCTLKSIAATATFRAASRSNQRPLTAIRARDFIPIQFAASAARIANGARGGAMRAQRVAPSARKDYSLSRLLRRLAEIELAGRLAPSLAAATDLARALVEFNQAPSESRNLRASGSKVIVASAATIILLARSQSMDWRLTPARARRPT